MLSDRCRADEAHRRDVRVREQHIDRLAVAVDDVEHAIRKASFFQELGETQRTARILLRGLEHECVSAGDGHGEHPHRHHCREIEGRNARADTDRLTDRPAVDRGAHVLGEISTQQVRDAAGELDDLEPADHLAARIRQHLAVLERDEPCDLIEVRLDERLESEHDARALQGRRRGPRRQRAPCGRDRRRRLRRARERELRSHLAGRRVENATLPAGLTGDELPVDEMAQQRLRPGRRARRRFCGTSKCRAHLSLLPVRAGATAGFPYDTSARSKKRSRRGRVSPTGGQCVPAPLRLGNCAICVRFAAPDPSSGVSTNRSVARSPDTER